MNEGRNHRRHAVRVAGVATGVVMACYVVAATILNLVVTDHLVGTIDARLADRLHDATQQTIPLQARSGGATQEGDVDDAPVFLWSVGPSGSVTAFDPGSPALPRRTWTGPITLSAGTSTFRFDTLSAHGRTLVAGQSMANVSNVQSTLLVAELVFGALLAVAVFGGALIVGLRASAPSELVRQRQAEFTADASHELRTPISVMEAEVDLALSRPRDAQAYREVLERLGAESRRLRHIVEDLLWLARADDDEGMKDVGGATADVGEVVDTCVQRFSALAKHQRVALEVRKTGERPFSVRATAEVVDRLAGVLIDNACKFAGDGGQVRVSVSGSGNHVSLVVDDSGPGIPEEQREAVFDRFHRGTGAVGGTGLGLAIADSIVRSTDGHWNLGVSDMGGARMEVRWRRAALRRAHPDPDPTREFTRSFT